MNGWPHEVAQPQLPQRPPLRISVQSAQGRLQQGNRPRAVTALQMVERSSDLNEPLQKSLLRLLHREPHCFPMFVGLKESAGPKAAQSFA
jgi:hypothetical protein